MLGLLMESMIHRGMGFGLVEGMPSQLTRRVCLVYFLRLLMLVTEMRMAMVVNNL